MYALVPTISIARAPLRTPFGLNVRARSTKLLSGFPSRQRAGADENQPFVFVGHVNERIQQRNGRFFVVGVLVACRVGSDRRGSSHIHCVLRSYVEPLPHRRDRCRHNAFAETLVIGKSDVENPQAQRSASRVNILAAMLQVEDSRLGEGVENVLADILTGMFAELVQIAAFFEVLLVVVRVGEFVQFAADDRLRFAAFGHLDREQTVIVRRHPAVFADEVHKVRAVHHQLGEHGVVVLRFLKCDNPHRVWFRLCRARYAAHSN